MVNPVAAEVGEAIEAVGGVEERLIFELENGLGEGGGEGFVGVDTDGEGMGDEGVGEVFLLGVAFPGVGGEFGAETMADGLGGVGGAGVDDDDFVNDGCEGLEAAGDVALFVLGD